MTPTRPHPLPIDYLECARMDIHGNAVARDNTLYVRLDDVDAVIDTLKAERARGDISLPPCKQSYSDCPIRINEAAIRNAARKELLTDLQTFIDNADSRRGCPYGTLGIAYLVQWMGGQGYDCD